ncbi:hypothetical protein pb186bvf_019186 [Paramecium bursaria]
MESPVLNILSSIVIKEHTNRYSICRIIKQSDGQDIGMIDDDTNSVKSQYESTDTQVNQECFVYAIGNEIFTLETKEPSYIFYKVCITLKQYQRVDCLTAFPYVNTKTGGQLPQGTLILIAIKDMKQQLISMYDDSSKEIQLPIQFEAGIIWMQSRLVYNNHVLLILAYQLQIKVYIVDFNGKISITEILCYKTKQVAIYSDITFYDDSLCCIALASYDGVLDYLTLQIQFRDNVYESNQFQSTRIILNKQVAQPKFILQQQQLDLIIPQQNGPLLLFQDITKNNLSEYKRITYSNQSEYIITAFDIQLNQQDEIGSDQQIQDHNQTYSIVLLLSDGKLQVYEYDKGQCYFQLVKQMNQNGFFISYMPFCYKQFIMTLSYETLELFEMFICSIN